MVGNFGHTEGLGDVTVTSAETLKGWDDETEAAGSPVEADLASGRGATHGWRGVSKREGKTRGQR